MNCQKYRTEIEELERGAALTESARAHAAGCDSCRAFRAGDDSLRALVGGLARVEAPGDFEFRLRARIARSEGVGARPAFWRGFVPGGAWLTVAGCLVLALGVFVRFRPGQTTSPQSAPAAVQTHEIARAASTPGKSVGAGVEDGEVRTVAHAESLPTALVRSSNRTTRAQQSHKFILPHEAAEQLAGLQNGGDATETLTLDSQGMKIYVGTPIALPVSTHDRPLEALFKDTSGATRSVSVDAVTFGARDLRSRRAQARNASYTQGVW
jgi:hypothetical protein